jgi:hypothetical protein
VKQTIDFNTKAANKARFTSSPKAAPERPLRQPIAGTHTP